MLASSRVRIAALFAALVGTAFAHAAAHGGSGCMEAKLEGEVQHGQVWSHPIGNGLQVMLDPLASGWILRVLPASGPRPQHDYAELATPPYDSVSPLLLSTDFSFRAQDAVGWNPRRFHFAPDAASYRRLSSAYEAYRASKAPSSAAQQELVAAVVQMSAGTLEILDARLVPGIADQTGAAAAVASHFLTTAHSLDQPQDGRPTPLGRLDWVRFRIDLDLPQEFRAATGLQVTRRVCQ
jgi:hypothetical protein